MLKARRTSVPTVPVHDLLSITGERESAVFVVHIQLLIFGSKVLTERLEDMSTYPPLTFDILFDEDCVLYIHRFVGQLVSLLHPLHRHR